MDKHRILLVDDSPNELRILMEILKDKYAIVAATSGFQALKMIEDDEQIELVLLDVMMPDQNGYETCEKIHQINPNLPVMFVSGNTHTEEILKGFDVGGLDYLTKPIDAKLVSRKVEVVLEERKKIHELEDENKSSSDMVMSVIASAGHLGTVLGFLRAGLKIKTPEGLVSALFDVFDSLNIDACVQLRLENRVINRSSNMVITPLEKDLLGRAALMSGRFLEKGTRYIVNFENVSVIIKNMPVEDEMARGDLRDNLMMIIEDTNALSLKVGQMGVDQGAQYGAVQSNPSLRDELLDVVAMMKMVETIESEHKQKSLDLLDDMLLELEASFFNMGITQNQEDSISQIVQGRAKQINGHIEEALHVEQNLAALRERIKIASELLS
jgi:CheY-like chemotaxis protein